MAVPEGPRLRKGCVSTQPFFLVIIFFSEFAVREDFKESWLLYWVQRYELSLTFPNFSWYLWAHRNLYFL